MRKKIQKNLLFENLNKNNNKRNEKNILKLNLCLQIKLIIIYKQITKIATFFFLIYLIKIN